MTLPSSVRLLRCHDHDRLFRRRFSEKNSLSRERHSPCPFGPVLPARSLRPPSRSPAKVSRPGPNVPRPPRDPDPAPPRTTRPLPPAPRRYHSAAQPDAGAAARQVPQQVWRRSDPGPRAPVSTKASTRPMASTAICRLRPLAFVALSQPRLASGIVPTAVTDRESMTAAAGRGSRPTAVRAWSRTGRAAAQCRHRASAKRPRRWRARAGNPSASNTKRSRSGSGTRSRSRRPGGRFSAVIHGPPRPGVRVHMVFLQGTHGAHRASAVPLSVADMVPHPPWPVRGWTRTRKSVGASGFEPPAPRCASRRQTSPCVARSLPPLTPYLNPGSPKSR
jgi:hypothetical protein